MLAWRFSFGSDRRRNRTKLAHCNDVGAAVLRHPQQSDSVGGGTCSLVTAPGKPRCPYCGPCAAVTGGGVACRLPRFRRVGRRTVAPSHRALQRPAALESDTRALLRRHTPPHLPLPPSSSGSRRSSRAFASPFGFGPDSRRHAPLRPRISTVQPRRAYKPHGATRRLGRGSSLCAMSPPSSPPPPHPPHDGHDTHTHPARTPRSPPAAATSYHQRLADEDHCIPPTSPSASPSPSASAAPPVQRHRSGSRTYHDVVHQGQLDRLALERQKSRERAAAIEALEGKKEAHATSPQSPPPPAAGGATGMQDHHRPQQQDGDMLSVNELRLEVSRSPCSDSTSAADSPSPPDGNPSFPPAEVHEPACCGRPGSPADVSPDLISAVCGPHARRLRLHLAWGS